MKRLVIQEGEELVDALRRELGREPQFEDFVCAWGGRVLGQSIVEPRSDHLGQPIYKGDQT